MKEPKKIAKRLGIGLTVNIARYIFLIAYSYVLLYPMFYILANAFGGQSDYYDPTVQWVPKNFTFDNISAAVKTIGFWDSFKTTLIYEIISAFIEVASCAVAAYGLARYDFRGKKILMGLMILSILIPANMLVIPNYVNFRFMDFFGILGGIGKLVGQELRPNLVGSPLAFWLPSVLSVGLKAGLFIYIYMQFFKGLPKELEEAAWVDGAGPWKTFLRIIIPSSSVPITIVTLFSVVWHWSDYYSALMYISDTQTLNVNLSRITALYQTYVAKGFDTELNLGPIALAACLLFLIPILIFYLFMQKKFIASIANSGIVG